MQPRIIVKSIAINHPIKITYTIVPRIIVVIINIVSSIFIIVLIFILLILFFVISTVPLIK